MTNVLREVDTSKKDEQVQRILDDPDGYFSNAWQVATEQVKEQRRSARSPRYRTRTS